MLVLAAGPAVAEAGTAAAATSGYIVLLPTRPAADRAVGLVPTAVSRRFHSLTGFQATLSPSQVIRLRQLPGAIVEPDRIATLLSTQLDPPWGLDRLDQEGNSPDYTYTYGADGRGVNSYVIDSGVAGHHNEFSGRLGGGYSVVGGTADSDCAGHGTHVAGTMAGSRFGVAKGATIIPVRVFGCGSTTDASNIIAGIDFILSHHSTGSPAVANLSIGMPAYEPLDAAVEALIAEGITVVAAAGNEGADACATSPARVPGVVTVAGVDRHDAAATWSNWGACVDLFAPAVDIRSASPDSPDASVQRTGTSMAAPHAAGAAARYLSSVPSADPGEVAAFLAARSLEGVVEISAGRPTISRLLNLAGKAPLAAGLGVSATSVGPGESVTLTASLVNRASGTPAADRTVTLQKRLPGARRWSAVAARVTGAAGRVRYTLSPSRSFDYRSVHSGSRWSRGATSPTRRVTFVQHTSALSIATSSAVISSGDAVTVRGVLRDVTNSALMAGKRVDVQRRALGSTAWRVVTTDTTSASGGVEVRLHPRASSEYRLAFAGSTTTRGSRSTWARVRIRSD